MTEGSRSMAIRRWRNWMEWFEYRPLTFTIAFAA
jgi:hypothetical protein